MANFCGNCGTKTNINDRFCMCCGQPIEGSQINKTTNSKTNDSATTGLILSLIGFLFSNILSIPGLIICISSLQKMNKGEMSSKNKSQAIAGIVVASLGILVLIISIIDIGIDIHEIMEEFSNVNI